MIPPPRSANTATKGTAMSAPREQTKPNEDKDPTTKFGAFAIVGAFVFPPTGLIFAYRCYREAGKRKASRTLAFTAFGFVLAGLIGWSLYLAILTRNFPFNVDM
jgi:hypothetical protein